MSLQTIKERVGPVLRRHGARRAGLFGSAVRGEMTEESDVDILVELDEALSLLDVIHIQHELEDALGREVDLVEYSAIKPLIRERVLSEEVPIL